MSNDNSQNRINFYDINLASEEEIEIYLGSVEAEDFRQQILQFIEEKHKESIKDKIFVNNYAADVTVNNSRKVLFFKLILNMEDILATHTNVVSFKIKKKILSERDFNHSYQLHSISLINSVQTIS